MQRRSRPEGRPVAPNGLPLSRIHHAAFDAYLIGMDPDYRVHVSDLLVDHQDGTMLEVFKLLDGGQLHLSHRPDDYPDQDRLPQRFELFENVAKRCEGLPEILKGPVSSHLAHAPADPQFG